MTQTQDPRPDEPGEAEQHRGPAIPTVSVNAAEQDPDPSESSSDPTAPHKASDYDNDREDLPESGSSS